MKRVEHSVFGVHELARLGRVLSQFFSAAHKRQLIGVSLWVCVLSALEMLVAASVVPYVQCLGGQCPAIVESLLGGLGLSVVPLMSLGVFLLITAKLVLQALLNWKAVQFNQNVQRDTVSRLLDGYLHLDWANFKSQHRAHYFRRCATTAVDAAYVSNHCVTLISSALLLLFLVSLMLWQYPQASFSLVIGFVVLNLLTQRLIGPVQKRFAHHREAALQRWNIGMAEAFASFREIRVYGLERFFLAMLDRAVAGVSEANQLLGFLPGLPRLILDFSVFAILLLVVNTWLVMDRPIADLLPQLIFYAVVARACLPAMMNLLSTRAVLHGAMVNIELILQELATTEKHRLMHVGIKPTPAEQCSFALEQVSFRHTKDAPEVVSGVNFKMEHPAWLALVGSSGAGKSTLIELLCGVHVPQSGRVMHRWAGGADSNAAPRLAYLPQHVALLDGSVMDNVVFGFDPGNTDRVDEALLLACLDDVVAALPEGRDAQIGADGARLSGGERQRLALARALYRRPDLLLLDEATSGLDEATETRLLSAIRAQFPEMSVVYITHRSSNLCFADQVLRLQDGLLTDVTPAKDTP